MNLHNWLYNICMKIKFHKWNNSEDIHYVSFQFTPIDYYIVKSMDIHDNEYQYSLNPKIQKSGIVFDYGSPVIFISKEQAELLIKKMHFIQVHNNNLY